MLDVPRELVDKLAGLLRRERRRRGTRRNSRALSCGKQALLGLVWFRKNEEMTTLAAGFGISRATGYRYRDEVTAVLAAEAPDLHEALQQVAEQGWSHVIVDGKVFRTDRCADTTTSAKGTTIHSWYSGKHRAFGGNVQAVMRPDRHPILNSQGVTRHHHHMTAAPDAHLLRALFLAASPVGLPTPPHRGHHCRPRRAPARGLVLGGVAVGPAHPRRRRLSRRWPRHPRPLQAARRRERPCRRSSGIQRAAARSPGAGRTRLRPTHPTLAGPATHHRKPFANRRHHRRRTHADRIRTTRPTPILLRSPHCRQTLSTMPVLLT